MLVVFINKNEKDLKVKKYKLLHVMNMMDIMEEMK